MGNVILDACLKIDNYTMKTIGVDAFYSYYISYHYFKISKICRKFKNGPIVNKSTSQVADIIHSASMEFENFQIITVGEDAFLATICYTNISNIQKFAKNSKIVRSSKKAKARLLISYMMPVWNLKTIQ